MKRFVSLVVVVVLLFLPSIAIAQEPQPQRREGPAAMLAQLVATSLRSSLVPR